MSKVTSIYRRYALAGATFSVAVSIGILMQSGEASHAAVAPAIPEADAVSMARDARLPGALTAPSVSAGRGLPDMPQEQGTNARLPDVPTVQLVSRDVPVGLLPEEVIAPVLGCDSKLTGTAAAGAMVELWLSAPCQAGERVTFHHQGLQFTETMGPDDGQQLRVPALAETARFAASFPNGDGAVVTVTIDSLAFYDRAAIQWTGEAGLGLHALEYGADYGSAGHVWRDAPRDLSALHGGGGGFHVSLGDRDMLQPSMIEVYTFPSGTASRPGSVELSLEAEVSPTNCGNDVNVRTLEINRGRLTEKHELSFSLPECDAAGEFLVLKNVLQDLKIAER